MKDPGALLVLANLTWDDEEPESVRKAAGEALHEMSGRFRKYAKVVADLDAEAEQRNFLRIAAKFEQGDKRYVQSAYIIGRHYMRLGRYEDAREWRGKAEFRNRNFRLYGNRILRWIRICGIRLIEEADESFAAGESRPPRTWRAVWRSLCHLLIR